MSIARNSAYNIAGGLLPLAATLVTLPSYLRAIGDARYGVLAILWTLLGYFGLFDLGLGSAVTNRIALLKHASIQDRGEVFWTALMLNVGLGIGGALALWGGAVVVFRHFVALPGGLTGEIGRALPLMCLAFPLLLTSSVLSGALMGREEFLQQNIVRATEGVLIQVVPLLTAIRIGHELPTLVAAVLGVRLLGTGLRFVLCTRAVPVGVVPVPRWSLARPLFAYGSWVTVTGIIGPLMDGLDRVIIGAMAGVTAVTFYTVPFSLASRLTLLPGSLSSALFPRFSFHAELERRVLMYRGVRILAAFVTPLVLIGIAIMTPFLSLWISPSFATRSGPVGEILLCGIWANCLAYLPFSFLQAGGRPDLPARLHLLEVGPYILVLWLALSRWGLAGAALAWSVRAIADAVLQFWYSGADRRLVQFLSVPAVSLVVAAVSVQFFAWPSARWAITAIVLVVDCCWFWSRAGGEVDQLLSMVRVARSRPSLS